MGGSQLIDTLAKNRTANPVSKDLQLSTCAALLSPINLSIRIETVYMSSASGSAETRYKLVSTFGFGHSRFVSTISSFFMGATIATAEDKRLAVKSKRLNIGPEEWTGSRLSANGLRRAPWFFAS